MSLGLWMSLLANGLLVRDCNGVARSVGYGLDSVVFLSMLYLGVGLTNLSRLVCWLMAILSFSITYLLSIWSLFLREDF